MTPALHVVQRSQFGPGLGKIPRQSVVLQVPVMDEALEEDVEDHI